MYSIYIILVFFVTCMTAYPRAHNRFMGALEPVDKIKPPEFEDHMEHMKSGFENLPAKNDISTPIPIIASENTLPTPTKPNFQTPKPSDLEGFTLPKLPQKLPEAQMLSTLSTPFNIKNLITLPISTPKTPTDPFKDIQKKSEDPNNLKKPISDLFKEVSTPKTPLQDRPKENSPVIPKDPFTIPNIKDPANDLLKGLKDPSFNNFPYLPSSPSSIPSTSSIIPSTPSIIPSTPSSIPSTPANNPSTPSIIPSTPSTLSTDSPPSSSLPTTPNALSTLANLQSTITSTSQSVSTSISTVSAASVTTDAPTSPSSAMTSEADTSSTSPVSTIPSTPQSPTTTKTMIEEAIEELEYLFSFWG